MDFKLVLPLIYINIKGQIYLEVNWTQIADDTRHGKQITYCTDVSFLQSDINSTVRWSTDNNMVPTFLIKISSSYSLIKINNKQILEEFTFTAQWLQYTTPSNHALHPTVSIKDLGVHLSSDMKWSFRINSTVQNGQLAIECVFWPVKKYNARSLQQYSPQQAGIILSC